MRPRRYKPLCWYRQYSYSCFVSVVAHFILLIFHFYSFLCNCISRELKRFFSNVFSCNGLVWIWIVVYQQSINLFLFSLRNSSWVFAHQTGTIQTESILLSILQTPDATAKVFPCIIYTEQRELYLYSKKKKSKDAKTKRCLYSLLDPK